MAVPDLVALVRAVGTIIGTAPKSPPVGAPYPPGAPEGQPSGDSIKVRLAIPLLASAHRLVAISLA